MKSGTTTLYRDLLTQPALFLPDKEANYLLQPDPGAAYAQALASAREDQLCGDVSPDYAKLPESADALPHAQRLFAQSPRIIYILREPLSRLLSHHYYMSTQRADVPGRMGPDLAQCLEEFPSLLNYSRYAMQLRPWMEAFGRENVLVLKFEDYVADRIRGVEEVCAFLGVEPDTREIQADMVYNKGDARPVITPFWQRIQKSRVYREKLRPFVPLGARDRLRSWFFPKPEAAPQSPPEPELLERIVAEFRPDVEELRVMLGHEQPLWDMDAVLERASQAATSATGGAEG